MATATKDCQICCTPFNKKTRRTVTCAGCDFVSCMVCVRQFLQSQDDPQCMRCRKRWDREYLLTILPKTVVDGEMRKHRENVLFEREKALLPGTMPIANAYQHASHLRAMNSELAMRISELQKECKALERNVADNTEYINQVDAAIKNGTAPPVYGDRMATMHTQTRVISIIRGCPSDGCRGFIDRSNYKCGVCDVKLCKQCHEVIGGGKAGDADGAEEVAEGAEEGAEGHVCKPENIESARLIANSTKPCPTCSVPIFKVDGCDQMWCTQCRTAFSWRTGAIEKHVHNPHYYEWMRSQAQNGEIPREPGDMPCGNRIRYSDLLSWFRVGGMITAQRNILEREHQVMGTAIIDFHMLLTHCANVEVPRLRVPNEIAQNAKLRVQYMLNEMDEANFKRLVCLKEKKTEKQRHIFQIMETFVAAANDIFRNFIRGPASSETATELLKQLQNLREYTNNNFNRVAGIYNCTVPRLGTVEVSRV